MKNTLRVLPALDLPASSVSGVDRALHVCPGHFRDCQFESGDRRKVSAAYAAIMAVDAGETSVDVQKASDVLATQVEVW